MPIRPAEAHLERVGRVAPVLRARRLCAQLPLERRAGLAVRLDVAEEAAEHLGGVAPPGDGAVLPVAGRCRGGVVHRGEEVECDGLVRAVRHAAHREGERADGCAPLRGRRGGRGAARLGLR